jgi:hypothetical protein
MLKRIQYDTKGEAKVSCHPELVSGSRFWIHEVLGFKGPACG